MSRTVTPPQPSKTAANPAAGVPHELIAKRAYEKWCKRGKPVGTDRQDWLEAEAEIRNEISKGGMPSAQRR